MIKRREMVKNTARECIEYTEICKTLKKKAKEEIRKHNQYTIRKTIETSKSLNKVRRTHILGQNRLITLLDNQGREIQDQDKILERIEEFYTKLYDSDQTVTILTDPRKVPSVTTIEAALKKMKNGKATGNDQVNIETLKAGEDTIAKALAKLYTKCISERRIPTTWKNAKMVIIFKKGNQIDIKNYRPICLLSNIYKLFTKILTARLEKILDDNQPREQAGFRGSMTHHIHVINQLKEKCREFNRIEGIEDAYIQLMKDIYTDSSVIVYLHKESEKMNIKRGV